MDLANLLQWHHPDDTSWGKYPVVLPIVIWFEIDQNPLLRPPYVPEKPKQVFIRTAKFSLV
jgi:hypothetical protein